MKRAGRRDAANDGDLILRNCEFSGEAGPQRCPAAVGIDGFSQTTIQDCLFNGFNFTVQFGGGSETVSGDFTSSTAGHGLSKPGALEPMWEKWTAVRGLVQ
jgi:hypothetical protein